MSKPSAIIMTHTGKLVDLLNMTPDDICIEDIAHHLSNICRFTGATRQFYSVAQHCCLVAELLPPELKLEGLLHDAAEAYVGDMSSPLKRAVGAAYKDIERGVTEAIVAKFDRPHNLLLLDDQLVKAADNEAFYIEARWLMPQSDTYWPETCAEYKGAAVSRRNFQLIRQDPRAASLLYKSRFREYWEMRV